MRQVRRSSSEGKKNAPLAVPMRGVVVGMVRSYTLSPLYSRGRGQGEGPSVELISLAPIRGLGASPKVRVLTHSGGAQGAGAPRHRSALRRCAIAAVRLRRTLASTRAHGRGARATICATV